MLANAALARVTDQRSGLMRTWSGPGCQAFYRVPAPLTGDHGRLTIPRTVTSADMCPNGRDSLRGSVWRETAYRAQDIVVVPQFRLVYLVVRKAASSAIQRVLATLFNASTSRCGDRLVPLECGVSSQRSPARCSTLCLDNATLQRFFFYSFVRDPEDRFYSAFEQALVHASSTYSHVRRFLAMNRTVSYQLMRSHLRTVVTTCQYNQHLESQATSFALCTSYILLHTVYHILYPATPAFISRA